MAADATTGLLKALTSVVVVIVAGYFLARLRVLTPDAQKTLGKLLIYVFLPALIFTAMATLDLSSVDWSLFLGVLVGKSIVTFGTALITVIATQYPAGLVRYLYIFAPITFLVILPTMVTMLEYAADKISRQSAHIGGSDTPLSGSIQSTTPRPVRRRRPIALVVALKVLTTPPVVATVLGLAANFAFKQNPSDYISQPLDLLGSAFSALALLNLGASIVGKLHVLRGQSLVTSILLVMAKSLLMPIVLALMLSFFHDTTIVLLSPFSPHVNRLRFVWACVIQYTDDDGTEYKISLFAFVYGTVPSAPGAFAFAITYGADVALIGATVILNNILAAPLMFVSAKMAAITLDRMCQEAYFDTVYHAGTDVGYGGAIIGFGFIVLCIMNNKWQTVRQFCIFNLAVAALGFAIASVSCEAPANVVPCNIRFSFVWFMLHGVRVWGALLAFNELGNYASGDRIPQFLSKKLVALLGWGIPALLVGSMWLTFTDTGSGAGMYCWFRTKRSPFVFSVILLIMTTATVITCIMLIMRRRRRADLAAEALPQTDDETASLLGKHSASSYNGDDVSVVPVQRNGSRSDDAMLNLDDELDEDSIFEADDQLVDEAADQMTSSGSNSGDARTLYYLGVTVVCSLIDLATSAWTTTLSTRDGVYVELMFLNYVLIHGQGLVLFAFFGTDGALFRSLLRHMGKLQLYLRRCMYDVEIIEYSDANPFDLVDCDEIRHIIARASRDLPTLRRYRLKAYRDVMRGSDFVTYLVRHGAARDREHATSIGRALLSSKVLAHVTNEHHFHDAPYFYRFSETTFECYCGPCTEARDEETQTGGAAAAEMTQTAHD
ncbi:uncharacterized protein MONBRDRAFT_32997 [Monosiga brevicollis MX1]|uniref:DEP domain-containing protein n=1 Tax=Monosiga brevicollis TaxID=81824 RepID=A9V2Y1_MONBE|nr:uncharacterized protein MONBRDRAFT_32997 [Monosiga brevicollis MX1]EDQ88094.1 predicted protein [Monosiga brevicollis MX1]|eukprot:XP_001747170.1 hypothetical protein [Monosiga brevicollis MX1]